MSWFSNQWSKWSANNNNASSDGLNSNSGDPNNIRRIEVVWGRERLQIVLPKTMGPLTLAHLKHEISSITSLPYERIKLIHRGLIMKDDRSALSAYGLRDGSRVGLVGSRQDADQEMEGDKPGSKGPANLGSLSVGEQKLRERKAKEADTSEQGLMNRISETLDLARKDLFPDVVKVEEGVAALTSTTKKATSTTSAPTTTSSQQQHHQPPSSSTAQPTAQPSSSSTSTSQPPSQSQPQPQSSDSSGSAPLTTKDQLQDAHRRLSELLLRQLLNLDSVAVNSDTTRQARKQAVKEVQSHLDRLDSAWNQVKSIPTTSENKPQQHQ